MSNEPKKGAKSVPWAAEAAFLTSAVSTQTLPAPDKIEVAFAGRSNVGKSTLLNALAGRKGLAKASNTPGRTRMLNYFTLKAKKPCFECYLVDMPGYGFARAGRGEIRAWTGLVKDYLKGRAGLRRVFLLIDMRRGVMAADKEILTLLQDAAVSTQAVLTKADKLRVAEREGAKAQIARDLKPFAVVHPDILVTSSLKKTGIEKLRAAVLELCHNGGPESDG